MLKGGQLPLDFFVIGESTPDSLDRLAVGGTVFILLLEKSWF